MLLLDLATTDFHAGNTDSNPVGDATNKNKDLN